MKFQVEFDKPDKTYSPGDLVTCRWRTTFNSPKSFNSIYIRFYGRAVVRWEESSSSSSSNSSSSTTYSETEEYFKSYIQQDGGKGQEYELKPGEHDVFEASFLLPKNIPESYDEGFYGKVIYEVKIHLKSNGRSDKKFRETFFIERRDDAKPNLLHSTPQIYYGNKEFGLFSKETLRFQVHVDPTSFQLINDITGKIFIYNETKADIKRVNLTLREDLHFYAEGHKKYSSRQVTYRNIYPSNNKKLVEKYQNKEFEMLLPLDHLKDRVYLFDGCVIIKSEYFLEVDVVPKGLRFAATVKIPLKSLPF